MVSTRTVQRAIAGVLLIFGVACRPMLEVWLAPGATAARLAFEFGSRRGRLKPMVIVSAWVDRCSAPDGAQVRRLWRVVDTTWIAKVRTLVYGEAPPTFRTEDSAAQLAPGCYRIELGGGSPGRMQFEVGADGSIREL